MVHIRLIQRADHLGRILALVSNVRHVGGGHGRVRKRRRSCVCLVRYVEWQHRRRAKWVRRRRRAWISLGKSNSRHGNAGQLVRNV